MESQMKVKVKSLRRVRLLVTPWTRSPPGSSFHGILQERILEWVAMPSSKESSQPRDQTRVSCIAGRFFTFEPPGKFKNSGVGSLSLLQGIFPIQESSWGLLHSRRVLYQLSYRC